LEHQNQSRNEMTETWSLTGLLKRAADLILAGPSPTTLPTQDVLRLEVVGVLGVTPAAYGLDCGAPKPPAWYRTDAAVYFSRYQNGWGKAELEDGARYLRAMRYRGTDGVEGSSLKAA
jgi:hypothetical protein